MTQRDDPAAEHDAYLRSALQHAPDATLAPSEALNQAILARARSATATSFGAAVPDEALQAAERAQARAASNGSARGWRRLANLWAWFGQPAVATGFAGLMVATLVGVMWWDRPLDDALPQRAARPPAVAASWAEPPGTPDADQRPSAAPAAAETAERNGRDLERLRQSRSIAAPEAQRSAIVDGTASAPPEPAAANPAAKRLGAGSPKPSAVPAPSAERTPLPMPAPSAERTPSAAPAPSTERTPAPAETSRADSAASTQGPEAFPSLRDRSIEQSKLARRDRRQGDDSTATEMKREAQRGAPTSVAAAPLAAPEAPSRPSLQADTAGRVAQGSSTERREMPSLEATPRERLALNGLAKSARPRVPSSPLPALRAALVAEPGRWTWTTDDSIVRPATAALQHWLERLDAAATAAADTMAPAIEAPADPKDDLRADRQMPVRTVTLLRDGQRHTSLRIAHDIEAAVPPSFGGRWQARLSARDAAALRASVPER